LHDAMDQHGLKQSLIDFYNGDIKTIAVDTPVPSAFSHDILNSNPYAYLDDAPLEERRARAVEMRRVLPASVLEEVGALDPAAIAQVRQEAWPDVRDADELHDVLHTLVMMPESGYQLSALSSQFEVGGSKLIAPWTQLFDRLQLENRAVVAEAAGKRYWVAAERIEWFEAIHSVVTGLCSVPAGQSHATTKLSADEAVLTAVQGWIAHLGPTTASEIGD